MLAWYLYDEPDVWSIRPEIVQVKNQKTKSALNAPTTLVIGQGKTKYNYYNIADILMVDWYPVPHLPLVSFGEQLSYARQELDKDKELWGVVQIFDWKDFKQFRPDDDRIGRYPTYEEISFMSWHGILEGATGLFYFAISIDGKYIKKQAPKTWKGVKKTLQEIKKFSPIIEEGAVVENVFTAPQDTKARTWLYQGKFYTLLLNMSDKKTINLPSVRNRKVLFGDKKVFTYNVSLKGINVWHNAKIELSAFKTQEGMPLRDLSKIDALSFNSESKFLINNVLWI